MIIKNIDRSEIERLRSLGFKGRFRLRGPRRNIREHQDASPEVATHGTLYTTNSKAPTYALTGWAGEKPIFQQLDSPDSRPKHLNHTNRRVIA